MPFLGREKGRSPRSRRSDDEFVVFLQGIPAHCRWQELKDLVRQTALHIRQAVVYDDHHGFPTGLGQIIVKNEDEAWRTYHRLSTRGWEGQSLVVTLARTSAPTNPIAGPTKSPPVMMPSGYGSGHSTPPRAPGNMTMPPSPISPEYGSVPLLAPSKLTTTTSGPALLGSTTYQHPVYGPMVVPMALPPQQFMPMMPDPFAQAMPCFPPSPLMPGSMFDPPSWSMMPAYHISPMQPLHETEGEHWAPTHTHYHPHNLRTSQIDLRTPTCYLEQRAISVRNLNRATTSTDLKTLLQDAGTVEQCHVGITSDALHSRQGQTHGTAIMQSAEEARRAIIMFNNLTFMGSRIRVKVDHRSHAAYSGSWDDTVSTEHEEPDLLDVSTSSDLSEACDEAKDVPARKIIGPCQPLVVDGSGLTNKVFDVLSISAPT